MRPRTCKHCRGTGRVNDIHGDYECFWCDGFGVIDDFTTSKTLEDKSDEEND